jgi:hypothetical protein
VSQYVPSTLCGQPNRRPLNTAARCPHSERRHRAPHSCHRRPGVAATKNRLPDAPFERAAFPVFGCGCDRTSSIPRRSTAPATAERRCSRRGQHGCRQDGDRSDGGQGWGGPPPHCRPSVCARSAATRYPRSPRLENRQAHEHHKHPTFVGR